MRIQCNACEVAEAKVLCCADEAALCLDCDEKVHGANKLAGKHQRVPLLSASSSSSRVPNCDICQDDSGYFFCLEDRAILCRNCDVAVHTANPCVSIHQRFLLTGVQVGLESTGSVSSVSKEQSSFVKVVPEPSPKQPKSSPYAISKEKSTVAKEVSGSSPKLPKSSSSAMSYSGEAKEVFSSLVGKDGSLGTLRTFLGGASMAGSTPEWPLDEFFRFTDFNQNNGFSDHGSSKADSGKLGRSEGSPLSDSFNEDLEAECLGQVPEIPSPPTTSGLNWPKNKRHLATDFAAFVPDIYPLQGPWVCEARRTPSKCRRSWHS